jgi:hypothetical protein
VRDKDGFVVLGRRVDGHEGELEQLEREGRLLLVLLAERLELAHEVLEHDGDELVGDVLEVGEGGVLGDEKGLRDVEDVRVDVALLNEEVHLRRPDLGEDVRVELEQDLNEELERLLLVPHVLERIVVGDKTELGLEELPKQVAVRRRSSHGS